MLPEKDLRNSFQPSMLEFVPEDTLRAIHTLRRATFGVALNPPLPSVLSDLVDTATSSENHAEGLIAELEHLALRRGGLRRQVLAEERASQASGKASVLSRLTVEQRALDEQIEILSAKVTLACEDAIGAKARVKSLLPDIWQEWHSDLAAAVIELNQRVRQRRDETITAVHALRKTISQMALIDSLFAPLTELTHSGLTVRNVAKHARESYNDAFTNTLFHLERLAFDLPERTQPAQWLNWALQEARPDDELTPAADASSRA